MDILSEEQKRILLSLPETEKVSRFEKATHLLLTVGEQHIALLKEHHESDATKEIGFAYFYPTVQNSWDQVKFSLFLGEGPFLSYNFFPARLLCENVFRLEHYTSRNKIEQNEICLWETLRISKRFYDTYGDQTFKDQYERACKILGDPNRTYPDISDDKAYHDPFPRIQKLIEQSRLPSARGFYSQYQFLCESQHGKLISLHIAKNQIAQYRRNLLYIFIFCRWLLLITDAHIGRVTKDVVTKNIDQANNIAFSV